MTKTNKITVLAEITILPGFEKKVMDAATKIWIATRKENGCELFIFNTPTNKENVIVFFEVFKSAAAFDEHRKAEHTKIFLSFINGKVQNDGPALTFLNQFEG